jgi:hypothetical protein
MARQLKFELLTPEMLTSAMTQEWPVSAETAWAAMKTAC